MGTFTRRSQYSAYRIRARVLFSRYVRRIAQKG
jgi:hypothetical protein